MMDQLISLKDFRARCGLSKATLTRLFARGEGPARTLHHRMKSHSLGGRAAAGTRSCCEFAR
jgi:hypothetical protein